MADTLTNGAAVLPLPKHLLWPDEFSWQQVKQSRTYGLTGRLRLESAALQAGQPMTIQGGANTAWVTRATLQTLRTWAGLAGQQFTLNFRGVVHAVQFDHERGPIEATPVTPYSDPIDADFYVITLRFIKV